MKLGWSLALAALVFAGSAAAQDTASDKGKLSYAMGFQMGSRLSAQKQDVDIATFTRAVQDIPEVVEVYRMSGETDYLLRVVASDIDDYDRVYKLLIRAVPLYDVSSSFAMEQIKYSTALPVRATAIM